MKYTITSKQESQFPALYGGGVRYRFLLQSLYLNGSTDAFESTLTVSQSVFHTFSVGDQITISIFPAEMPETLQEAVAASA